MGIAESPANESPWTGLLRNLRIACIITTVMTALTSGHSILLLLSKLHLAVIPPFYISPLLFYVFKS